MCPICVDIALICQATSSSVAGTRTLDTESLQWFKLDLKLPFYLTNISIKICSAGKLDNTSSKQLKILQNCHFRFFFIFATSSQISCYSFFLQNKQVKNTCQVCLTVAPAQSMCYSHFISSCSERVRMEKRNYIWWVAPQLCWAQLKISNIIFTTFDFLCHQMLMFLLKYQSLFGDLNRTDVEIFYQKGLTSTLFRVKFIYMKNTNYNIKIKFHMNWSFSKYIISN